MNERTESWDETQNRIRWDWTGLERTLGISAWRGKNGRIEKETTEEKVKYNIKYLYVWILDKNKLWDNWGKDSRALHHLNVPGVPVLLFPSPPVTLAALNDKRGISA